MGALFNAVIPGFHKEVADADVDFMDGNEPTGAKKVVGVRINDITTGAICSLDMAGVAVAYDGCVVGEVLVGNFTSLNAAGTVDSVIVLYV